MPQVQVLNRQLDPSAAIMQQGTQSISDTISSQQDKQANMAKLLVAIKQLDIDAKNSDNQEVQNKIAKQKQFLEYAKFLEEKGISTDLKLPALKQAASSMGIDLMGEGLSSLGKAMSLGADVEGQARSEARGKMSGQLEAIKESYGDVGGGDFPPGTSLGPTGITMPLNREYTQEEAKMLTTSEMLGKELRQLSTLLKANPNAKLAGSLGPKGLGEEGQKYNLLKHMIGERLLRLRSGAQINEAEYARFMGLLPSVFRKTSIDLEALDSFIDEFTATQGRITGGSAYDSESKGAVNGNEFQVGEYKVRVKGGE